MGFVRHSRTFPRRPPVPRDTVPCFRDNLSVPGSSWVDHVPLALNKRMEPCVLFRVIGWVSQEQQEQAWSRGPEAENWWLCHGVLVFLQVSTLEWGRSKDRVPLWEQHAVLWHLPRPVSFVVMLLFLFFSARKETASQLSFPILVVTIMYAPSVKHHLISGMAIPPALSLSPRLLCPSPVSSDSGMNLKIVCSE